MLDEMRAALGGLPEVLVNNAAVTHDGLLMMLPEAAWDRVLEVNLKGAYLCSRAVLRGMIAARAGRIVNIVSPAAFFVCAGLATAATALGGFRRTAVPIALAAGLCFIADRTATLCVRNDHILR